MELFASRGKVVAYPAGQRGWPVDAGEGEGEEFVFIKTTPSEREAPMREDPNTFFVTPHFATAPGVIVRLSTVSEDELRELLVEAWRVTAPKRLVRSYDET